MASPPTFDQVCDEFRKFRAMVGRTISTAEPSAARDQLAEVAEHLDKNFADFEREYPKAMAEIEEQERLNQQQIDEAGREIAESRAEIEKAEQAEKQARAAAAQTPPVPKPEVPTEPNVGPKLRSELLDRFGDILDPAPQIPAPPMHEVWEDWDLGEWAMPEDA
jgi:hypothetical protein